MSPPPSHERSERAADLYVEYRLRQDDGEAVDLDAFVREHPEFETELRELDRNEQRLADVPEAFPGGGAPRAAAARPANAAKSGASNGGDDTGDRPRSAGDLVEHISTRSTPFTRYAIQTKVGQGSMGEVFRVRDKDLRRTLAMKVLSSGFAGPGTDHYERTLTRFVSEAQVSSQLDHPSIVPIHDFGVTPDGHAYFTMKLVKGRELRQVIDELHAARQGGPATRWTLHRVLGLVQKVCEAMSYAHHKGVLHRDLKPTNVMVGRYGVVHVMDWGLARVLGGDHEDVMLADGDVTVRVTSDREKLLREADSEQGKTRTGASVGTPAYMAPEQAGGGGTDAIDERADIYGVGAILYHVVTGCPPYTEPGKRATLQSVLFKLQQGPPTKVDALAPNAPAEIRAIIRTAMARAPEARFQTMEQLAGELAEYLEGRAAEPEVSGRRFGVTAVVIAVAVAVVVGVAIGAVIGGG